MFSSPPECIIMRGAGGVPEFCMGAILISWLLGPHAEPYDNSFWEKVTESEQRKKKQGLRQDSEAATD